MKMVGMTSVTLAALLVPLTLACFITNCPPGGKRSGNSLPALHTKNWNNGNLRQCARCGPNMSGRCFGPRVCCWEKLGCLVGSAGPSSAAPTSLALLPCAAESLLPEPCTNGPSVKCGAGDRGICSASGVCCIHNSCHSDNSCTKDFKNISSPNTREGENLADEDEGMLEVVEPIFVNA